MNGKRVNVESLLTCGNIFRTFLIEERVGESEKAFHDFTTCGRLSYRIKSTRVWETSQEKQKSIKAWGRVSKASHLLAPLCSARFARSAFSKLLGRVCRPWCSLESLFDTLEDLWGRLWTFWAALGACCSLAYPSLS